MLVRQIHDQKLAQYAYLIGCPSTGEAIIMDPERDIDRYVALAAHHKLHIVAAADTHIHADYLSGLREFAERGVKVYASDEGAPEWRYEWLPGSAYTYQLLKNNDRFTVGNVELTALHTPGHTPEHLSYLVQDLGAGAAEPISMITGDFVFVGDVGRPDLLESAAGVTGTMEPGARQLYQSVESFKRLPEYLQVWPAHGAGSACGKSLGDVPGSTIGYELRTNPSIRAATSEAHFVAFILSGQPEPPVYFARMKRENRAGPTVLGRVPSPVHLDRPTLASLAGRTDVALFDTRGRTAFLASHMPASILAEIDYQLVNIVGSYIEERVPVYLVVGEDRLDEAVRALIRIGVDDIRGYVTPMDVEAYAANGGAMASIPSIDMAALEQRRLAGGVTILDVRGRVDFDHFHVPDAINVAHTRLLVRLADVPTAYPVLVHCNSGARSAHAASLLQRHGYDVTNVADAMANYRETALAASTTA
ncbi:MBL fold metallo-hydrolase [Gemmatimonas sp.]|uniref:MBL fold metallo-hydrolase n=1 Tax=Gemmatimonas sp. TaxID=1962908 RepID=UPI003DA44FC2